MRYDRNFNHGGFDFVGSIFVSGNPQVNDFGKKPFCNGRKETAPQIGAFCFPLCWRCAAFSTGVVLTTVYLECAQGIVVFFPGSGVLFAAMMLPMLADSLRQRYTPYESTNLRRIVTGTLCGVAGRLLCFSVLRA